MFRPPRPTLALVAAVFVLAGACSDASGDEAATQPEPAPGPDLSGVTFEDATGLAEVEIDVRDNTFDPQHLEVSAGTTITFTNVGRTEHNVYPAADGAFAPIDAADLEPGEARTLTLGEPGVVPYYCTLHGTTSKGMVGAIRVVA